MKKFIIMGATRSGTTTLCKTLGQIDDVACGFEAMKRYSKVCSQNDTLAKWIDNFYERNSQAQVAGFKMLYEHVDRLLDRNLNLGAILKQRNVHILHIQRESLLKQYISFWLAHRTRKWGATPYPLLEKQSSITIDSDIEPSIEGKTSQWLRQVNRIEKMVTESALPCLSFTYEALCSQTEKTLSEIQGFLGVRTTKVEQLAGIKQFQWEYEQAITNYQELVAWMQANELAHRV